MEQYLLAATLLAAVVYMYAQDLQSWQLAPSKSWKAEDLQNGTYDSCEVGKYIK